MHCPNCGGKVPNPMSAICEKCDFDLSVPDTKFVDIFRAWLEERISQDDISREKALHLLHLSSKRLRPVSVIDFWPEKPTHTEGRFDEETMSISLGDIHILDDVFVSAPEPGLDITQELFPFRELVDDPYIRIVIRNDVPLVLEDRVFRKVKDFLNHTLDAAESKY